MLHIVHLQFAHSHLGPDVFAAMAALLFSNKTVRDLYWVMSSPHLLTCHAGVRCLSDAWCAQLCRASLPWLRLLDDDPSHLHVFLRSHRNVRRLGF